LTDDDCPTCGVSWEHCECYDCVACDTHTKSKLIIDNCPTCGQAYDDCPTCQAPWLEHNSELREMCASEEQARKTMVEEGYPYWQKGYDWKTKIEDMDAESARKALEIIGHRYPRLLELIGQKYPRLQNTIRTLNLAESYEPKPLWTSRWLAFRRFINHVSSLPETVEVFDKPALWSEIIPNLHVKPNQKNSYNKYAFDNTEELTVVERKNPMVSKKRMLAYWPVIPKFSWGDGSDEESREEEPAKTCEWFVVDEHIDMDDAETPVNETYFESMREKTFVHFKIEVDMSYKKTGKKIITVDTAEYNKSLHRHTPKGKVKRTVKEDLDTGYALTVTFQHHQPELSKPLINLLERGWTMTDKPTVKFDRVNEELVNELSEAKFHTVNAFLKNEHPHEEEAKEILIQLRSLFIVDDFGDPLQGSGSARYDDKHDYTDHSLDHYKKCSNCGDVLKIIRKHRNSSTQANYYTCGCGHVEEGDAAKWSRTHKGA